MTLKPVVVERREIDITKTVLHPGETRQFLCRAQAPHRPDELLLPGSGTLRLDSVRIADQTHMFGVTAERSSASGGVAEVSLRAMQSVHCTSPKAPCSPSPTWVPTWLPHGPSCPASV